MEEALRRWVRDSPNDPFMLSVRQQHAGPGQHRTADHAVTAAVACLADAPPGIVLVVQVLPTPRGLSWRRCESQHMTLWLQQEPLDASVTATCSSSAVLAEEALVSRTNTPAGRNAARG
jgi:hypothetical protein